MPHLIISDEQMEGIVRFYAGFPICSGEQVETGASFQFVQVSKLQTRMFPGFFFNLLMFLSPAGGQLWLALSVAATPCQRLASPLGGRWCPVGTVQRLVSAAASVGDGRSPLGCITRAGRRECPRRGRRGPTKSCPPAKDRKSDKLSKNPGNMRAPQFVP